MKKVAIVTGGSRGIGFSIARQLGVDGYRIVILATGEAGRYQKNFQLLDELEIEWHYVQGSIDSTEDRKRLVEETVSRFSRIDVLVNNAGVAPLERNDLLEMTEESFDRVIGINTKGTMFLTQLVARQMIKQKRLGMKQGTIINVGSCSAEVTSTSRGEYCVSKAGVAMLTQLFADRLASENILVHEVRPGVIATDMTTAVKGKYDKLLDDGVFPIKRWGTPEDVANMVSVFCSDKVLYTTGNYIDVDGGFHIKRL
ncbi:3-ketoacyl-ACP reductase [Lacrimispora defluvii]|uniref:3-ketoacyl-ACP reductase n=1 Tax=Lacrimispora defluvii TaxID=2719233 RepID=A0ABX1VRH9_9FIRM|nr:3-ketoacyl-ACP reductase [Lacrimispora defluvii]NNJ30918.1 3-ketoacyl-ACP reductase [Lacrimispora defluvii]